MAKTPLTTMEAIRKVLGQADGPLKAGEVADRVLPLVPTLQGKTPKATVAAKLYTEAKKQGSWIGKTADGFVLREATAAEAVTRTSDDDSPVGDVPAKVVRDGRKAKPNPKPSARKAKAA